MDLGDPRESLVSLKTPGTWEDGKNLQCLLIQLDEDIELKTEAFERCLELGIEPNIPAVLEARLKKSGCEYEIFK